MKSKAKFVEKTFEELQLGIPLQFHKIQDITTKTKIDIVGIAESKFYNTKSMLCFNFYKHISRVLRINDI